MSATIGIVVVTYNSESVIHPLLDSITSGLDGLEAKIVVVDNDSADQTARLVSSRRDCVLIRSKNIGFAAGINLGISHLPSAGTFVVLNPDALLCRGSIRILVESLHPPEVGITCPKVVFPNGVLQYSLRREPSILRAAGLNWTKLPLLSEYINRPGAYLATCVADWALGAVLAFSRDTYSILGGWDESYFLYSEETDFCLRARDLGIRTEYQPDARVVHIGGGSGQTEKTHAMQVVNKVRLYRRRHSDLAAWAYYLLTVLSELTWLVRGHRRSWRAIVALLRPRARPTELGCSDNLLPA